MSTGIIVGCGRAGRVLHMPGFMKHGVEIIAVVETDEQLGKQFAADYHIPHTYSSLSEALKQETSADFVDVNTPPQSHLELATMALEAGKAVLLEKPIVINREEADRLQAVIQCTGQKLAVVHNFKYIPSIRQGIETIKRGAIGEVRHVEYMWYTSADDRMLKTADYWAHDLVGGRWAETMPHCVYISSQIAGKLSLDHVEVVGQHPDYPFLPGESVHVALKSGDVRVNFHLSAASDVMQQNMIFVVGSKDTLAMNMAVSANPFRTIDIPLVNKAKAKRLLRSAVGRVKNRIAPAPKPAAPQPPPLSGPASWHAEVIRQFVEYLETGKQPDTTWEEAYYTMALTDEIGQQIHQQWREHANP